MYCHYRGPVDVFKAKKTERKKWDGIKMCNRVQKLKFNKLNLYHLGD